MVEKVEGKEALFGLDGPNRIDPFGFIHTNYVRLYAAERIDFVQRDASKKILDSEGTREEKFVLCLAPLDILGATCPL